MEIGLDQEGYRMFQGEDANSQKVLITFGLIHQIGDFDIRRKFLF